MTTNLHLLSPQTPPFETPRPVPCAFLRRGWRIYSPRLNMGSCLCARAAVTLDPFSDLFSARLAGKSAYPQKAGAGISLPTRSRGATKLDANFCRTYFGLGCRPSPPLAFLQAAAPRR